VVGYHRVVEDFAFSAKTSIPSLLVSRSMLERHLDWIGRRYRFVDLDELGALLESGRPIEERVAAITFDDGYRDFYDHALPVLQRKGVPSALFVVTGLVGTTRAQIHDRLYFLLSLRARRARLTIDGAPLPNIAGMTPYQAMRALLEGVPLTVLQQVIRALESEDSIPAQAVSPSLSWQALDRIHRAGVVIGSHTKTHVVMTNETRKRMIDEVTESRQELEKRLGGAVRHFAYPSGIYDTNCVSAVAEAGYRFGYTTCTHQSSKHPLLTIPRMLLWEDSCLDSNRTFSESIMSCQVHRAFGFLAGCRQRHTTALERARQVQGNVAF
jgi:peptidoglycan/xylan/chitin deacetylase (PgdA/CDA1 family)